MSNVAEIEDALNKLPENQFAEIAFVVLERLRKSGHLPPFRQFHEEQVWGWMAEDEADMRFFSVS